MGLTDDVSTDNPLVDDQSDWSDQYHLLGGDSNLAADAGMAIGSPGLASLGNLDSMSDAVDGTAVSGVIDVVDGIKDGDWASVVLDAQGVALDVLGAVSDPIGAVAGQLLGWMLEHVEPLRMVLDKLTGSPDTVQGYADSWANIAERMEQQGQSYFDRVQNETRDWVGAGGDAYRETANETVQLCVSAVQGAEALSSASEQMKDVVDAVRSAVKDILSELAGGLLSAAIQAATLVLSPNAVRTALQRIANAGIKIADWVMDLTTAIQRLQEAITGLLGALSEIAEVGSATSGGAATTTV